MDPSCTVSTVQAGGIAVVVWALYKHLSLPVYYCSSSPSFYDHSVLMFSWLPPTIWNAMFHIYVFINQIICFKLNHLRRLREEKPLSSEIDFKCKKQPLPYILGFIFISTNNTNTNKGSFVQIYDKLAVSMQTRIPEI